MGCLLQCQLHLKKKQWATSIRTKQPSNQVYKTKSNRLSSNSCEYILLTHSGFSPSESMIKDNDKICSLKGSKWAELYLDMLVKICFWYPVLPKFFNTSFLFTSTNKVNSLFVSSSSFEWICFLVGLSIVAWKWYWILSICSGPKFGIWMGKLETKHFIACKDVSTWLLDVQLLIIFTPRFISKVFATPGKAETCLETSLYTERN